LEDCGFKENLPVASGRGKYMEKNLQSVKDIEGPEITLSSAFRQVNPQISGMCRKTGQKYIFSLQEQ
jgi:hypothetical protein